jgi:alkylhydroperoxidase/carboxymuconolactone decarboxylase family protein YurZ
VNGVVRRLPDIVEHLPDIVERMTDKVEQMPDNVGLCQTLSRLDGGGGVYEGEGEGVVTVKTISQAVSTSSKGKKLGIKNRFLAKKAAEKSQNHDGILIHFDQFWASYWRPVGGKIPARKVFERLIKTAEDFDRMMAQLEKETPEHLAREVQNRPYPATWLNRQTWLDGDTPVPPQKRKLTEREKVLAEIEALEELERQEQLKKNAN